MDKAIADKILSMVNEYGSRCRFAAVEAKEPGASHQHVLELNRKADAAYEAIRFTLEAHAEVDRKADPQTTPPGIA